MDELLSDLNEAQQRAVENPGGPLLVVAGPGTGKTRTLTTRIAYLVKEKGADPSSIAAITFTHRAANEMKDRLARLLDETQVSRCFIGTFHAFGLEIIKQEAKAFDLKGEPVLYDEDDRFALFRETMKELYQDKGKYPVAKVRKALEQRLNRGLKLCGLEEGFDLNELNKLYSRKKQAEGAVDFDDLLVLPIRLFNEDPGKLAAYRKKWRHIFVDEYQDVNAIQVEMIKLLGDQAETVMAIGDPDQAIYSFRGSDVRYFHDFNKVFKDSKTVHLENNYRSSLTIISASGQVISSNKDRLKSAKAARGMGEDGLCLEMSALRTEKDEARFISQKIEMLAGGLGNYGHENSSRIVADEESFSFDEIAVLYRLNAQARVIRLALDKAGIPLRQVGTDKKSLDLYERMVLASARLSLNPGCRVSWRLLEALRETRMPSKKEEVKIRTSRSDASGDTAFHFAAKTLTKSMPDIEDNLFIAVDSLLKRLVQSGVEIDAFLSGAPLIYKEDPFVARSQKVTLSTLHASKGLEFSVVFIAGLEEGIVPYIRKDEIDKKAAIEEERRLLYVGMTRAQKRLFLLRSSGRFLFGERLKGEPSPFLKDISNDLVNFVRESRRPKKKGKEDNGQMSLF